MTDAHCAAPPQRGRDRRLMLCASSVTAPMALRSLRSGVNDRACAVTGTTDATGYHWVSPGCLGATLCLASCPLAP
jgi:hypothetical protein